MPSSGEKVLYLGLTLMSVLMINLSSETTIAEELSGIVVKFDPYGCGSQNKTYYCVPVSEEFSKRREIRAYKPCKLSGGIGYGKRGDAADNDNKYGYEESMPSKSDRYLQQNIPESFPLGWIMKHSNVGTYSSPTTVNDDDGERRLSPAAAPLPLDPERRVIFLR